MIEKLRICFIDRVVWHLRCARWLNAAAEYTCNRVSIEKMHAHHLALEFDNRDIHEETLVPFRPGVDVANLQRQFSLDQGQKFLDQYLAKMAILAAVNHESGHSITRYCDPGRHRRRERAQASGSLQAQSSGQNADTNAGQRRDGCTWIVSAQKPGTRSTGNTAEQRQAVNDKRGV